MRIVVLLFCFAMLSVQSLVPAETRTVEGTVINNGEPIRGAVVQIENRATLQLRSYVTQQDGAYHFAGLPLDAEYQIWAKRGDMESKKQTVSQFNSKKLVKIDLVLE
jgi:hypothetical protein